MSMNDSLSNAVSNLFNCELVGKKVCHIKPISNIIKNCLRVLKDNGFVGSFTEIEDGRGKILKLELLGVINKCGTIKPRYAVGKEIYEKFEKRYLPAKDIGILIVSTPQGIMTHIEAKKKNIGGKLLLYCF